ncbi:M23 family metallopeptidase [Deinococcus cellulosilyticus]|uniref:M23 family metallopeptidase n=1 Tax=Deinococcus cellulosilyticus TaxID=401558 RepID=UPI001649BDBA|nr:M23 family metallopeptidase [Deinococcus cellulosilyticus]
MEKVTQPGKPDLLPVTRIVFPVRNATISTIFLDPKYFDGTYGAALKGQWHTGWDLNWGTGDQDLGRPVYCVGGGVVVFAGQGAGQSWGNIVVVKHNIGGKTRWTRYAHLQDIQCKVGQTLQAGQQLGTIGKGYHNKWVAHLHFDIFQEKPLTWSHWPGGNKTAVLQYYIDPQQFFTTLKAVQP